MDVLRLGVELMGTAIKTGPGDDDDPFTIEYGDGTAVLAVNVWMSQLDNVPVVQIDTAEGVGVLRVAVNDGDIWHGDPDADVVDDPDYPLADWIAEVSNGGTRLGYQLWVHRQRSAEAWP